VPSGVSTSVRALVQRIALADQQAALFQLVQQDRQVGRRHVHRLRQALLGDVRVRVEQAEDGKIDRAQVELLHPFLEMRNDGEIGAAAVIADEAQQQALVERLPGGFLNGGDEFGVLAGGHRRERCKRKSL